MTLQFVEAPHPLGNRIDYLEDRDLTVGIRNRHSAPIIIEEIALVFQAAHRCIPEKLVTVRHPCNGQAREVGALHYERVAVRPSLMLYSPTNMYRIVVTYCHKLESGFSQPVTEVIGAPHLIVRNAPNFPGKTGAGASVFVSFKDPEDLTLAETASVLLTRAGFLPYLARNDQHTGADYWEAKIEPAIRNAEGTLVIWTPNTVCHSGPVVRELTYSQRVGTPVGLFLEQGTPLPEDYPAHQKEYGGPFERDTAFVEFAVEIEASTRRWRDGQSFF